MAEEQAIPEHVREEAKRISDWWTHNGTAISTRCLLEDGIARALLAAELRGRQQAEERSGKILRAVADVLERHVGKENNVSGLLNTLATAILSQS